MPFKWDTGKEVSLLCAIIVRHAGTITPDDAKEIAAAWPANRADSECAVPTGRAVLTRLKRILEREREPDGGELASSSKKPKKSISGQAPVLSSTPSTMIKREPSIATEQPSPESYTAGDTTQERLDRGFGGGVDLGTAVSGPKRKRPQPEGQYNGVVEDRTRIKRTKNADSSESDDPELGRLVALFGAGVGDSGQV